jgi:hypothetical protein
MMNLFDFVCRIYMRIFVAVLLRNKDANPQKNIKYKKIIYRPTANKIQIPR